MTETVRVPIGGLVAANVLTAAILAADFASPIDSGVCALYAVPLLIVSYADARRFAVYGAWVTSLLVVLRALAVPLSGLDEAALLSRAVALIVIWTTASIVARLRATAAELSRAARTVNDVKYALDQSAIVATTDTRGTITYVNDKFCQISKYSREELLGDDHRILNSGLHSTEFFRDMWTTIANGGVWRGDIRNRAKDGTLYWVDTTIVPFLDAHGRPYQYMAIRYEITERVRQEALLREKTALARLGEMAAVVAHEVKNPIAGIRGALQVIASRMPADQRDRAVIGDVVARLDALNGIVQDLLLYSRPRQVRRELVDVRRLIESTADLLRRDPAFAGTKIELHGEPPPASVDSEQLRIAIQNLLMNAAQAMGGSGAIEVALDCDAAGCRIAIRDHGPGMAADIRAKAFDAFFTTKHRGTGLGLPIARRIVDAHGGEIAIATAEGGGTLATIALPHVPA
jgi:two-component system CheB/CheR fusion protein